MPAYAHAACGVKLDNLLWSCRTSGKPPPPLLRALAALDARINPAAPADPALWMAALAAPLMADGEPRKRGRPRKDAADRPAADAGAHCCGSAAAISLPVLRIS